MEFKTAEEANHALNSMNGHPFDSKHIFLIIHFTDVEKYSDLDEVFVEPEPEQYRRGDGRLRRIDGWVGR